MTDLLNIHWASIEHILYFPIFFIFGLFTFKNYFRIKKVAKLIIHPTQQKNIFPYFSLTKERFKVFFLTMALFMTFLALLQPQWSKKNEAVVQEGRDLLILLDVSRSMLAKDLKPSRLEFAKLKIRALLSKLHFDRVGLIAFSGTAIIQCPLTIDHATFLMFLEHLDVETISSGTTAIDTALQKAIEIFEAIHGRKNKNVLLLTDGEDFSLNLEQIKQKARQENITLFTLGIGTPLGAPIPILDNQGTQNGHETDEQGNILLSKLNESLLQGISNELNGKYLTTTYMDSDIDTIVSIINSMEKEKFNEKTVSLYEDQYPWFLGIAWFFLLLEWIL